MALKRAKTSIDQPSIASVFPLVKPAFTQEQLWEVVGELPTYLIGLVKAAAELVKDHSNWSKENSGNKNVSTAAILTSTGELPDRTSRLKTGKNYMPETAAELYAMADKQGLFSYALISSPNVCSTMPSNS